MNMTTPEIIATVVFGLISLLGLFGSISYAFNPLMSIPNFRQSMDVDFEPFVKSGKAQAIGFKKTISYLASTVLGANFMTLFIIWATFKEHSSFGWWSLWYWPIMFAWHFLLYKKSKWSILQVIFFVASLIALFITRNIAFL